MILKSETYNFHRLDLTRQAGFIVTIYDEDGPAWPRFYRGRWNGGGFGPCYTQTPIGYMWNCGQ